MRIPDHTLFKYLLILLALSSSSVNYSQTKRNNQIGLSLSYLKFEISQQQTPINADYVSGGSLNLSMLYNRLLTGKIVLNTGIRYLKSTLTNEFPIVYAKPNLIQVPIGIRFDLLDYLYIRSGLSLDYFWDRYPYSRLDDQSGMGFFLAGGMEFRLSRTFRFAVEPQLAISSLIPFSKEDNQQHLFMKGVCFSTGYLF